MFSIRKNILLSLTKRDSYYKRKKDWSVKKKSGYYLIVWLSNWYKQKKAYVHRLVAYAFIEWVDWKNHINHIDWDTTNNNYMNLEWVTPKENAIHSYMVLWNSNAKPIYVYRNWTLLYSFPSIIECSRQMKLYAHYISNCLNGHKKQYKWYIFSYNTIGEKKL